ncbi:MAG: hypothetical protein R3D66_03620 [Alphaproteobacteria bacterium]
MGQHLQMMCACTSSKIPDVMTIQQMQALQTDTEEGQFQRNRMMMFVYAPCIEYPTRAGLSRISHEQSSNQNSDQTLPQSL